MSLDTLYHIERQGAARH